MASMNKLGFHRAEFIKTAMKKDQYPHLTNEAGTILPEIAFAGRSNVGKSSLLNHLMRTKKLVKVSSTPGKTQALNFFVVDDQLACTDLPGYGYAKVPLKVRAEWGPMVQQYLEQRETLKVILFLLDIRRIPNEDDLRFLDWVIYHDKPIILVLTKVDKVKKNERVSQTRKILETLQWENVHYVHYSSTKNIGRDKLIALINEALEYEQ